MVAAAALPGSRARARAFGMNIPIFGPPWRPLPDCLDFGLLAMAFPPASSSRMHSSGRATSREYDNDCMLHDQLFHPYFLFNPGNAWAGYALGRRQRCGFLSSTSSLLAFMPNTGCCPVMDLQPSSGRLGDANSGPRIVYTDRRPISFVRQLPLSFVARSPALWICKKTPIAPPSSTF